MKNKKLPDEVPTNEERLKNLAIEKIERKKKVVYVTGCLGFIGAYVTRACLEKGWYVRGIDKFTYASNSKFLKEFKEYDNFIFERKDINDIDWLYDCDYIINTAAETHVDNSIVQSDDFIHSNVNGVHNLLELIRKNSHFEMPTLLHFSTCLLYTSPSPRDRG